MNRDYTSIFHNIEIEDKEYENERRKFQALWRSVITQALIDAASNSKKKIDKLNKIRAIEWLTNYSDDFLEVCIMANMDPSYVMRKGKEAMQRGCKWRNDTRGTNPIETNVAKLKSNHYKYNVSVNNNHTNSNLKPYTAVRLLI